MKDDKCIGQWYMFYECQKCGLMIVQKVISAFDLDRFILFDQDDFKTMEEAMNNYIKRKSDKHD